MTRRKEHFRITRLAKHYDKKTDTFTYNIAYETTTHLTPRTQQVAEAFGLGTDQQQKFTIYDNTQIKIKPNDIILITGDSGSGKSVLLKAIKHDLKTQATDINNLKIDKNKPIIETVGKTIHEALETLSKVGLNDAFLFLRTYKQLSDGQKTRYKIAKLVESQAQYWIIDEFTNTLDRDTAKTVAYNLQKQARQQNKAVIAATTHTDLLQDLNPSVHIHKQFGKEITINYHPNKPTEQCSLTKEMRIEESTFADYKKLSTFHYRTSTCPAPRKIFTLKRQDELCGVIVYSYPPPTTFGRNKVWKGDFQRLQKEFSTISRVVVHPKYRTIGLGAKLVEKTLAKAGTSHVETIAVMAKYNPFFEKSGMRKIAESKPSKHVLHVIEELNETGFSPAMLGSQNYDEEKIRFIGKDKVVEVLMELSRHEGALRRRLMGSGGVYPTHEEFVDRVSGFDVERLALMVKRLSFLAQTKTYLHWKRRT
jgi:ABC-type ATPase with predicted acetyltransferase domain